MSQKNYTKLQNNSFNYQRDSDELLLAGTMPGKTYQYTQLQKNTFNYPWDSEGLLLAGTYRERITDTQKLQKNTFNYPRDGERLALGGNMPQKNTFNYPRDGERLALGGNNAALCKMRGRWRGKENPRQLGVDECALRLLTARLPQGDQSDLQEVRVVLVHVCDGPEPDDLNGLVLPATRTLFSL